MEIDSLEQFSGCCLTCKYWAGDKAKQIELIEEYGDICMDLDKGWPESGICKTQYSWSDLQVVGDAYAIFVIESNFGCNRHKNGFRGGEHV